MSTRQAPATRKPAAPSPRHTRHATTWDPAEIATLHDDARRCAEVAGLAYVEADDPGLGRRRSGKGFRYLDVHSASLSDAAVKERITALAIPPAWRKVWICPHPEGHILATGEDERGRKQYIYHPTWRAVRDLLNFYRLMAFAADLPKIRAHVQTQLRRRTLDRARVLAAMIRLIDLSYIRVGNEIYAEENESVGLTTLGPEHVSVHGSRIELHFPGKSGKQWDDEVTDAGVARVLTALLADVDGPHERVFTVDGHTLDSDDVNATLLQVTGEHVTAKNFRTWGGTLAAFTYLRTRQDSQRKPEKLVVEAVDEAAAELGNTRSVARAHYVHPHVLETFTEHTFSDYLARSRPRRTAGLEPDERLLAAFLATLFDSEFSLLRAGTRAESEQ